MDEQQQAAFPFLSFGGGLICIECGRGFQHGERVELICNGPRVLPTLISFDGESSTIEDQEHAATFDLVHRECLA